MTIVICDHCKRNISETGNSVDYRILLASEPIPNRGGGMTDVAIEPDFNRPRHFCGMRCLKQYLETPRDKHGFALFELGKVYLCTKSSADFIAGKRYATALACGWIVGPLSETGMVESPTGTAAEFRPCTSEEMRSPCSTAAQS